MRTARSIDPLGGDGESWLRRNLPLVALAAVLLIFTAVYLKVTDGLTFYQDTWAFLMDRRAFTVDSLLKPHNEHIVLIPVLFQQLQLVLFGMTSALSEYVLQGAFLLLGAVLMFVYVRRRVGPWLALAFASLLLFVGPAWETMLWPFEICFVGSTVCGIGMLLALEREDRRGDVWACLLLVLSLGFNSLGIAFAAAAFVAVAQSRGRRAERAFVFVIPVALYALWYLGWGHQAENEISLTHALETPLYVLESLGAGLEALLGLSSNQPNKPAILKWGRALVVAFFALVAFGQWRRPGFYSRLWPVVAAAGAYWVLAGLNHNIAREPTTSRYLYATGAMVLLIAANLLKDVRIERRGLLVVAGVVLLAVASNLLVLRNGGNYLENQAVLTKADLGAMEIARPTIDPRFIPAGSTAGTDALINVEAGKYFPAIDEYGSPAYSAEELMKAPGPGPFYADLTLSLALPIETFTQEGEYVAAAGSAACVELPEGGALDAEVPLAPGPAEIAVAPGAPASFALRRFTGGEFPVELEELPGESTTELRIPRDRASQPWYLHVEAAQAVRVCPD
jgi:hypothetical protein